MNGATRRRNSPAPSAITFPSNCSCSTTATTAVCFGSIFSAITISVTRCPTAHNYAISFAPYNRPVGCWLACCSPAPPGRWRRGMRASVGAKRPAKPTCLWSSTTAAFSFCPGSKCRTWLAISSPWRRGNSPARGRCRQAPAASAIDRAGSGKWRFGRRRHQIHAGRCRKGSPVRGP